MRGHVHELIYRSRSAGPFDRTEIGRILATARQRNATDGLTGLLLYSDDSFLQVLEGEVDTVRRTFARIGQDPRHRDLTVLADGPVDARRYPDWTMGFHHLDGFLVAPGEVLDAYPGPAPAGAPRPPRRGRGSPIAGVLPRDRSVNAEPSRQARRPGKHSAVPSEAPAEESRFRY